MQLTSATLRRSEWDVFVGEWMFSSQKLPGISGHVVFEWLEGKAFLIQRSIPVAPSPESTWIVGADDAAENSTVLYCDSRGVSRVYRTSLLDGTWRIWRDAADFSQRFMARISADGKKLTGAWESSKDGKTWQEDFDLTYTKRR